MNFRRDVPVDRSGGSSIDGLNRQPLQNFSWTQGKAVGNLGEAHRSGFVPSVVWEVGMSGGCEFCGKSVLFVVVESDGGMTVERSVCAEHASRLELPVGRYVLGEQVFDSFEEFAQSVSSENSPRDTEPHEVGG